MSLPAFFGLVALSSFLGAFAALAIAGAVLRRRARKAGPRVAVLRLVPGADCGDPDCEAHGARTEVRH